MKKLVDQFIATGDSTELEQFMQTEEYRLMPYEDKNKYFITASKLRAYAECPYFAKLQYVDNVQVPMKDKDYFTVGQAIDDRLTRGDDFYYEHYEAVSRRTGKSGKVELTNLQANQVDNCCKEYCSNDIFPMQLKKKNLIWLAFGKYPCKAELDHFDGEEIVDLKTTANILTFKPMSYLHQMAFYFAGMLEKENLKCQASLCVVDKYEWSRSHKWTFSVPTLESHQYEINRLIKDWDMSMESGIWPMVDIDTEDGREIAFNSPYYQLVPECRSTKPTIL